MTTQTRFGLVALSRATALPLQLAPVAWSKTTRRTDRLRAVDPGYEHRNPALFVITRYAHAADRAACGL